MGKGSHTNSKRRVWTNTTFRRPVTTTQKQAPLALRHGVKNDKNVFNAYAIIKHPLASESAIKTIEDHNALEAACRIVPAQARLRVVAVIASGGRGSTASKQSI